MLRKLFVLTEISTHGTELYLKREAGHQQHVLEIDGASYTFGFGIMDACLWTDRADAETFIMMNEQHFGDLPGTIFQIQPIYKWYPAEEQGEHGSENTEVDPPNEETPTRKKQGRK